MAASSSSARAMSLHSFPSLGVPEIEINIAGEPGVLRIASGAREVRIVEPPTSSAEAVHMLGLAEQASSEGNFAQLQAYDVALKQWYNTIAKVRALVIVNSADFHHRPRVRNRERQVLDLTCLPFKLTPEGQLLARLHLPQTLGAVFGELRRIAPAIDWASDMLEGGRIDLDQMRNRVLKLSSLSSDDYSSKLSKLAEQLLKEGEKEISKTDGLEHFLLLLRELKKPVPSDLIDPLFFRLATAAVEEKLKSEKICAELVRLTKQCPRLTCLLGKKSDQVWLRVYDKEMNGQVSMESSRLLLSQGTAYFQDLAKRKNLSVTSSGLPELDLSRTVFNKESISLLLQWLHHSSAFSFNAVKAKAKPLEDFERVLQHFAAFNLRDYDEFLEHIQFEICGLLNDESLADILRLALRFNLLLLGNKCLQYINQHISKSVEITRIPPNTFKVVRGTHAVVPKCLQLALDVLNQKISKAKFARHKQSCWQRGWQLCSTPRIILEHIIKRTAFCAGTIMSAQVMSRNEFLPLSSTLGYAMIGTLLTVMYDLLMGVARFELNHRQSFQRMLYSKRLLEGYIQRTVICADAIVGVQSAARIPLWQPAEIMGVSAGVALAYPIAVRLFRACVESNAVRRCKRTLICCTSISEARSLSSQRICGCFTAALCGTLTEHTLKKESKNKNLLELDLTEHEQLTDAAFEALVLQHPGLQHLILGVGPLLSAEGYAALRHLPNLKKLSIHIPNCRFPGILDIPDSSRLKHLNLREIFGLKKTLEVEVTISSNTLATLPLLFLKELPEGTEVNFHIRNNPLPLLFSPEGKGRDILCREAIAQLIRCPKIDHLDLGRVLCDAQHLERIAKRYPGLRSIKVAFYNYELIDEHFAQFVARCPHLETVHLQGLGHLQVMTTDATIDTFVRGCPKLREISLSRMSALTNHSLELLATAPNLQLIVLNDMPGINDAGVMHLLNRKPALNLLQVTKCPGLSAEMRGKLSALSMERESAMQQLRDYHQLAKAVPLPLFQLRQVPAIFFQLCLDNKVILPLFQLVQTPAIFFQPHAAFFQLCIDGIRLKKENKATKAKILANLGIARSIGKFILRTSTLQKLAGLRLDGELFPLIDKKDLQLLAETNPFLGSYILENILGSCLSATLNAYFQFIETSFYLDFRTQVYALACETLKTSESTWKELLSRLKPIPAWLLAKNMRALQGLHHELMADAQSPLQIALLEWAQAVGEKGVQLDWSDDLRYAAFLGVILVNLEALYKDLVPHKVSEDQEVAEFELAEVKQHKDEPLDDLKRSSGEGKEERR